MIYDLKITSPVDENGGLYYVEGVMWEMVSGSNINCKLLAVRYLMVKCRRSGRIPVEAESYISCIIDEA